MTAVTVISHLFYTYVCYNSNDNISSNLSTVMSASGATFSRELVVAMPTTVAPDERQA